MCVLKALSRKAHRVHCVNQVTVTTIETQRQSVLLVRLVVTRREMQRIAMSVQLGCETGTSIQVLHVQLAHHVRLGSARKGRT